MSTSEREHDEITERLSDYVDGTLSVDEHRSVEEHLAGCGACRRVLEELSAVVERARALGPIEPPRDLWTGIAATIRAPAPVGSPTKIIAFPGADARPAPPRRPARSGLTLSRRQLVAASVALVAASSLATWFAGPGLGVRQTAPDPAAVATESAGLLSMASGTVLAPPADLADELAELEGTLLEARDMLDPNTVRILERNLGVIEQAIADSRNALAQDPGNQFLTEHLERVYQRKLTYLRDVVQVAEWSG
jgi:hypothetical protein